jgi:NADH dehydrogenase FAD-containing subunit
MKKYVYNRAGEIVTLGRTNAVGDLFGVKFSGWLAQFMKKVVHWWYLHSIGGFSLLLG